MTYFQTKNPNFDTSLRALEGKLLAFTGHLAFLRPFGIFYGYLVDYVVIWCIFSHFGRLYLEKSGNPALGKLGS
jgi:hypothetical protein